MPMAAPALRMSGVDHRDAVRPFARGKSRLFEVDGDADVRAKARFDAARIDACAPDLAVANRDVAAAVDIDVGIETVHRDRLDAVVVELAVHDSAAVGLRIPVKIEEIQTGKTVLIAFGIIEPYVLASTVMPCRSNRPGPDCYAATHNCA